MYTTAFIIERIKEKLKATKKTQKEVLTAAGANVNLLNQASDKKGISIFTLANFCAYRIVVKVHVHIITILSIKQKSSIYQKVNRAFIYILLVIILRFFCMIL